MNDHEDGDQPEDNRVLEVGAAWFMRKLLSFGIKGNISPCSLCSAMNVSGNCEFEVAKMWKRQCSNWKKDPCVLPNDAKAVAKIGNSRLIYL